MAGKETTLKELGDTLAHIVEHMAIVTDSKSAPATPQLLTLD